MIVITEITSLIWVELTLVCVITLVSLELLSVIVGRVLLPLKSSILVVVVVLIRVLEPSRSAHVVVVVVVVVVIIIIIIWRRSFRELVVDVRF